MKLYDLLKKIVVNLKKNSTPLYIHFVAVASSYLQDGTHYTFRDLEDALEANRTVWFNLSKDGTQYTFAITYIEKDNQNVIKYEPTLIETICGSDEVCQCGENYLDEQEVEIYYSGR